ncbi:MAG TPA: GspMb/PilO family protein [Candidatus Ozemobacteraceae bacterium]|nr:GspMb/PilO family protein [Candidatus Ozemobacteraceae bacterium]HQG27957.1 GspMb/PilO family protein [Candidatus Ozemobacteraceae bacterium]
MKRGDRAVLLLVSSCAGITLLFLIGVLWFPKLRTEYSQARAIMARLPNPQTLESEGFALISNLQSRSQQFAAEMARIETLLQNASFTPRSDKTMPEFVEDLQKALAHPGVTVLGLSYQTRIDDGEFTTLPFEARFECTYAGLRALMYALEMHPAGIFIERLEFQSFNNDRRCIAFKAACKVRFRRE